MTSKEQQYFDVINKDYMSDESDSPDCDHIIIHKHPWRSTSMFIFYILYSQLTLRPGSQYDGR